MTPTSSVLNDSRFTSPIIPVHITLTDVSQLKVLLVGCDASVKTNLSLGNFEINVVANIHQAKKFIQLAAETNDQFDAIICDASLDEKSVLHFAGYINTAKDINICAFLVFYGDKSRSNLFSQQNSGLDDIISPEISQSDLTDKINFLKKYKQLHSHLPYKSNEEANVSVNKHIFLKRLIDIVFSSLLLILVSPILILIAIIIKLESKGPVFYKSLRAGTNYKIFTFFKFRTMVINADEMVADLLHLNEYKDYQGSYFFKIKDDPRVTRVGQILRKTSLDELPQLINVLKGDMSLVGNRPLPLHEAQSITVDKSVKRFLAPAGITGLWQVKGRSNVDLSVDERIKMDIDYADNQSFLYDMKILLRTPKELILKNNV